MEVDGTRCAPAQLVIATRIGSTALFGSFYFVGDAVGDAETG